MGSDDLVKQIMDRINEYNQSIFGFDPMIMEQKDLEEIMGLCKAPEELTAEQCDIIALKLTQHSFATQFRVNRIKALLEYLGSVLRKNVATNISQFKGVSWEYAEAQAIQYDSFATEINEKIREYKLIFDSVRNQTEIIRELAKRVEGLKYGKRF